MTVAAGNIGGVFNSFLYPRSDAPHYTTGNILNIFFAGGSIVFVCIAHALFIRRGRATGVEVLK